MRIAILLSLLFHMAAAFHQLHYLVVIPADLRYPSTQVACLHITCYEAKLQVNLVLERSAGRELLAQETIQKEKTFMCAKFWVAPPGNGTEEIATVKLIIAGEGVNVEEKKKVLIRKASSSTFIQTDKPIYQPGQTVKFRVVTLDEEFIALNDSDPKNNRIEQWLNVVPQDGIADLSFQLSDEPLLGTYIINVTNAKVYGSFSVEEYGLTKFEVIFEVPNQIYALDKTFPLRVCGRYTYGKGVQGMVHVNLCQKIAPFLPSASKPDLCQEFNNQTDKTGCFFTNVSLSSFSRDFRYYQDSIVVEASLVEDGTVLKGFFSIPLTFSLIDAPAPRLVVYVIFPNGKIIADSAIFSVSMCFRNKVELGFSTPQILPDSEVGLHLLAAPGSTCAVWAVDQSVLQLKPGEELSSSLIYGLFPSVYNSRYPRQVSEDDHSCGFPNSDEPDVFTAFREMGLKIMSNTNIKKPRVCPTTPSTTMLQETVMFTSRPMLMFAQPHKTHNKHLTTSTYQPAMFSPVSSADEKVHKHFPKTWIWDLYSVGPSGSTNVTVTVPNTITEWKAGMFCTGRNGFGLAPTSSLLVFKPFLVELTLPSSVIQGETFILKAIVFNYLQRCMKIQVTLKELTHFQLKPCKGCVYSSCLCANEDKTFQWTVTAEQLGYQIQLQYQHPDGSYSEFGTKDEYGNTWLTAFVVKCFVQAKSYIFLDNRIIQAALTWLEFHQLPNGCFRNVGQLFHTAMKGGVDGEVPLAAYITAAYLEAGETPESTVVRKALGCIAPSLPEAASTYTQALLAYTFALAKDSQRTQELLDMLDRKAIRAGGQIHWSQTSSKSRPSTSPWSQPLSMDVELTAYVLLALLSKPNVTGSDLTTASGIVTWLTRQQNAYGGFASTQDTVVALQALAKYAALTYSTKGVAEVRVRSQRGFRRRFQVSYRNRLLVQEAALTEVPGKFSVQAHGSCCVFTRMVLRYNTPSTQVSTSFALRVKTEPANCTDDDTHSVTVYVNVRYTGKRSTSSMVIVEVSLLSGFVLAPGSGMSLQHWHPVRRTEKTKGGVAIYLDKLSHKSETYVLHLEREIGVTNLKPGHVRVYDYYHPEEQALANYNVFCI
ncbi:alpha-2-macroglobulin-like protein 1 [Grus japonensis]|uniref:Alpha-2-macroglobulin-like protein 1 n=1 Tax=Grus japonensis TaxID=30415 RepID=A0ABC9VXJ1_GRUJA